MPSISAPRLVVVAPDVEDSDVLLSDLAPGVDILRLLPGDDGPARLADTLERRPGTVEVHVIAHGAPGGISLGANDLHAGTLASRADTFARIRAAVAPGAMLMLYGCRTGAGAAGAALIAALSRATGAEVAASSTPVGRRGGWALDRGACLPAPVQVFGAGLARFPGTLGTIMVTSTAWNTANDGEVTLIEAILAANGTGTIDAPPTDDGFDRIQFDPGLSGSIIVDESVNANGVPALAQDLEIVGNGSITVAAANDQVRFAAVFDSGIDVTLDTLTFTSFGGLDPFDGDVIYTSPTADGTVTLRNVTVASSARPVDIKGPARLEIETSTFRNNEEAIEASQGEVYIANSSFLNNTTTGAIGSAGLIEVGRGSLEIRNTVFENNTYDRFTSVLGALDSDTSISGSLFTGNDMLPGDGTTGTIRLSGGTADIVNTTIVNPVDPSDGTAYAVRSENGASGTLANSIVIDDSFGGPVADGGTLGEADIADGGDNILRDAIPPGLFVDFAGGDWRLQSGAPAIDAGRDGAVHSGLTSDLAGNSRILGSAVDIGAYEYVNTAPTVALDNALASIVEGTLGSRRKVADVTVTDDGVGFNDLSLSGPDAALFEIDGAALYLRAGAVIDVSSNGILDVTVEVDDASLGGAPDDTADLSVSVVDLIPGIAPNLAPGTAVAEDAPDGTQVGAGPAVTATGDAPLSLTLSDDAGGRFAIDAAGVITIADASLIDFETATSHRVAATARDNEGNSATLGLTIAVSDVDEPPVFAAIGLFTLMSEDASDGEIVGDVDATDGDGGAVDAGLTYAIVGGNTDADGDGEPAFSIDGGSGVVTVNDAGDIAADPGGDFALAVEADDGTSAPTETVFIDVVDDTPPTLISLTPPDDAIGVALGADITLTFDEEIALGTGTIRLVDDSSGATSQTFDVTADAGPGDGQVRVSGDALTIDPAGPLAELTPYHVEIDAGALTDTADTPNPFAGISGATGFNFTTADVTPPEVVSIVRQTPTDATTDADTVTFRVAFSEAMAAGTVGAADFALSGTAASDGAVGAPVQVDPATYDVTVTGIAASNGTLGLDLASGATLADLAGNALADTAVAGPDESYTIANNTPPSLAVNSGSTLDEGGTDIVTTAELQATDPEEGPAALTFTLEETVAHGTLWRDDGDGTLAPGEGLAAGDGFTQADIDAGLLRYTHDGGETTADTFRFGVSDGLASIDGRDFAFTIAPVNDPPSVSLDTASATLAEDADTSARIELAEVTVTDPDGGVNAVSVSGVDAGAFEIDGGRLVLRAGAALDFETAPALEVTVAVDDPALGTGPEDTADFTLTVTDVNEAPGVALDVVNPALSEAVDTRAGVRVADIRVSDDALGTAELALAGPDAGAFEIDGGRLLLRPGVALDFETQPRLDVTVTVDDPALGTGPDDAAPFSLQVRDANEAPTLALADILPAIAEDADTAAPRPVARIVLGDDALGGPVLGLAGPDAGLFEIDGDTLSLRAGAALDFETAPDLAVTVTADDPGVAGAPDATASLALPVTDANDTPGVALTGARAGLPEALAAGARAPVAEIAVTDDALGSTILGLAGADAGLFEIDGETLFLRGGTVLEASAMAALSVDVTVSDPALGPGPAGSATFAAPVLDTTRAGTDGADLLEGGPEADILSGLGGDDRLAGGPGDDLLDGGPGRDRALFEGAPQGFTITFGPGGVVVTERVSAGAGEGGGADRLVSIEALDFALPGGGTETLDLAVFLAVLEAEAGELRDATLAYVALLDRLPDALGLYYWAGQLAGGADLGAIAAEFVQTGEAQAIWGPALGDPGALIDLAYERILGREADAGGARFWTEALETGGLAPGAFLWQFTLGAVRGDGADARTLSDKIDLGLAFAAIEGLTDVEAAGDALDLYDPADRAPSRDAALAFIDALASTAAAPAPGDDAQLLAPLSGLVDDPFAMA